MFATWFCRLSPKVKFRKRSSSFLGIGFACLKLRSAALFLHVCGLSTSGRVDVSSFSGDVFFPAQDGVLQMVVRDVPAETMRSLAAIDTVVGEKGFSMQQVISKD